ncbi:MAG TPA: cytochrome c maturation protein CcmE [Solirubrobacterales bacterium]|jgi:cytochrome c-type biogenesis protein CcmE
MDSARKRKIRLVVALSAAVLLAAGLVYTSFSASTEAKQPSQLLAENATGTYELTGKVVPGSIQRSGDDLRFRITDRDGSHPIPVTYTGTVPDPFRDGREVILTGKLEDGTFVGEKDSLITKCPSKFTTDTQGQSS